MVPAVIVTTMLHMLIVVIPDVMGAADQEPVIIVQLMAQAEAVVLVFLDKVQTVRAAMPVIAIKRVRVDKAVRAVHAASPANHGVLAVTVMRAAAITAAVAAVAAQAPAAVGAVKVLFESCGVVEDHTQLMLQVYKETLYDVY